jgi:hypothetical protein
MRAVNECLIAKALTDTEFAIAAEKRGFDQVRLVIEADPVKLLKMTLRAVHCQLLATQRDGVFS